MITIAHLSDLHFGREQADVLAALEQSLAQIAPELILISGDLTQRATHREYRQARAFLDRLTAPCFLVPGNHDLSAYHLLERFLYPWRKWRHYIQPDLEPVYHHPRALVIGINSARRMGLYLDWSRGRINPLQVAHIEKIAAQATPEQLRIVVAHHPFWLPQSSLRRHLISGRDQAITALKQANIDLILGGHIHLDFMHLQEGILISHAGTGISDRLLPNQPNSFNLIQGNTRQLQLSKFEWLGDGFQDTQHHHFEHNDNGWQRRHLENSSRSKRAPDHS